MVQFLLQNVKRRDDVIGRLAKAYGVHPVEKWDGVSIPCFVGNGNGFDELQLSCRNQGIPYIYIDHAYFRRGFSLEWYRICLSHYHCTDWRESDRKWSGKVKDWKKDGKTIVFIPPNEHAKKIYKANDWLDKAIETVKNNTNRRIVVKNKGVGSLSDALENAFAVVSFGSVAEVEAAMSGIPVFCSEYSPCVPIGTQDFTRIETPSYPDRTQWLKSLAAAEYTAGEEIQALERICQLAPIQNYKQL